MSGTKLASDVEPQTEAADAEAGNDVALALSTVYGTKRGKEWRLRILSAAWAD